MTSLGYNHAFWQVHFHLGETRHAKKGSCGIASAILFAIKANLRLFKFGCVSTEIKPAPSQLTNIASSEIGDIFVCLATRMNRAISPTVRCSSIGSLHTCCSVTESPSWAFFPPYITKMILIGLSCTRIFRRSIGGIYRAHRSTYDGPSKIYTVCPSITPNLTRVVFSRIFM